MSDKISAIYDARPVGTSRRRAFGLTAVDVGGRIVADRRQDYFCYIPVRPRDEESTITASANLAPDRNRPSSWPLACN